MNEEIRTDNTDVIANACKKIADLENTCKDKDRQLNNWYKEWQKQNKQIEQAKEIIKKFSEFTNNEVEYDPEHPQEHTNLWNELCKKAENFLKEGE